MRLLITGGSGYLGQHLFARARENSSWVTHATYLTHPVPHAERLDITDERAVDALIRDFQPRVIVHTAFRFQEDARQMHVNADGTRFVARAAQRVGARLIHLSSDVIFDGERGWYRETDAPRPITPYARTKAAAEHAVLEECRAYVIVRTSLIYGFEPLDPRTRAVLCGEMPKLFVDEFRCPIWVNDLAEALLELAANDFVGILHVAGPERLSRYAFGVKLAHALGVKPLPFEPTRAEASGLMRPRDCSLDCALARQVLKTRVKSVDEVLSPTSSPPPAAPPPHRRE
jgi:dTDP-4-dehydrorhamnose reductase